MADFGAVIVAATRRCRRDTGEIDSWLTEHAGFTIVSDPADIVDRCGADDFGDPNKVRNVLLDRALTFGVGWVVVEGARRGTDAPRVVEV